MKILLIFLVFTISHRVLSQPRLVVNTTCLELAKPSNQQLRLPCRHHDYHCLLDETFTKEFEACREWKWIPGGKCAYFNTYGKGNVDERECKPQINLTCSEIGIQFESKTNTQFTACYVKRGSSTPFTTTTSLNQVTSNVTLDGDIEISSTASEAWIIFFLYVIVVAVIFSISVIFYIQRYMGKGLCIKETFQDCVEDPLYNYDTGNDNTAKRQVDGQVKADERQNCYEDQSNANEEDKGEPGRNCNVIKERESSTDETDLNDDKEKPAGTISGSYHDPQQFENEEDKKESTDINDDTIESSQQIAPETDEADLNDDKETPAGSISGSYHDPQQFKNEEEKEESTDIFDDTFESLQQIPPKIGEKDRKPYTELFNLLGTEGLKLSQEVMAAIIFRKTGKSTNTLVGQEKNKLTEVLSEEHLRILESEKECATSFHVSHGLHQIYLDEAQSPKSGWGNPVREKDIGIGDDVERLNRIQTIFSKISNPETLSVENYIRLLDIMVISLIRLDSNAKFEQRVKALDLEIARYKKTYLI